MFEFKILQGPNSNDEYEYIYEHTESGKQVSWFGTGIFTDLLSPNKEFEKVLAEMMDEDYE